MQSIHKLGNCIESMNVEPYVFEGKICSSTWHQKTFENILKYIEFKLEFKTLVNYHPVERLFNIFTLFCFHMSF